jgi:hypothetical protein
MLTKTITRDQKMNSTKFILLTWLIVCVLSGCIDPSGNDDNSVATTNDKLPTKYFLKLTGVISPYQAYRPRIPITEKEAESTNHYRVNYDSKGRISRIMHFSKGLLNDNSYLRTSVVAMEYGDTLFIRRYFDQNNEPASVWRHYYGRGDENIYKEVFELDSAGTRKSLMLFNDKDEQIETGYGTYRFEWETLDDGSFIQRAFKRNGEINILMDYFDFLVTRITEDENGYLDLVENYGKDGSEMVLSEKKGAAYVDFHFDEYGNEESYSFHDTKGDLINRSDTGFGSYGYAKVKYIRKTPSKGINDGYETIFFDKNNRQTTPSDGVARHVDYFNDNGDYSATEYYSINDEKIAPAGIGYFRSERHYNEAGDKSETKYFDTDGHLTNNPGNGAAIVSFIYDNSRVITRIEKQDKDGNSLEESAEPKE